MKTISYQTFDQSFLSLNHNSVALIFTILRTYIDRMRNYINNNCIDSLSHFLGIFMHTNIRTFMHAYVHLYNVTSLPFLTFTANPEGALYSLNCLMRAECSQIPIT